MNLSPDTKHNLGEGPALTAIRRALAAILILGLLGTATELILLKHTEDLRQWVPLALIVAAFISLGWQVMQSGPTSTRAVRWIMIGFLASGVAGIYLHYQGSAEFKLESNPSLSGWPLFWTAIVGKAPPLLAPGAMIQLGLLGLAYTYKHPALIGANEKGE
jgi:hypothetical protein